MSFGASLRTAGGRLRAVRYAGRAGERSSPRASYAARSRPGPREGTGGMTRTRIGPLPGRRRRAKRAPQLSRLTVDAAIPHKWGYDHSALNPARP